MWRVRSVFSALLVVALCGDASAALGHVGDVSLGAPLGAGLRRIHVAKAADGGVEAVEKSIFIKATPEECFRVASGYEDYPKWAKATAGVTVLTREGGLGKNVEMRMGMFGIEVKSTFQYTYSRPTQMEWKSVAGTIKVCGWGWMGEAYACLYEMHACDCELVHVCMYVASSMYSCIHVRKHELYASMYVCMNIRMNA